MTDSLHDTALLVVDLQNDFVHPEGAYARGGQIEPRIAALPARIAPLVGILRERGGLVVATLFTLVPGRNGEPLISPHLKQLRPFLGRGDFASGSWGQRLVGELGEADLTVEKIAYSAFYMTRLEWLLQRIGIRSLIVCGIVTNGGVTSTVRDAHARDFKITVLADGCAAFSEDAHATAIDAMRTVAAVSTVSETIAAMGGHREAVR